MLGHVHGLMRPRFVCGVRAAVLCPVRLVILAAAGLPAVTTRPCQCVHAQHVLPPLLLLLLLLLLCAVSLSCLIAFRCLVSERIKEVPYHVAQLHRSCCSRAHFSWRTQEEERSGDFFCARP